MRNVTRGIFAIAALAILVSAGPSALADSARIQCDIQLDKTSVAIGETVSATINVTGGVEPLDIRCNWQAASDRGHFTFITPEIPIQNGESVSCTPAFGTQLIIAVSVTDAIGQYESFFKQISVSGGSEKIIDCSIASSKETVVIGESVSATVHVTGGVEPLDIRCNWQAASDRGHFTFITPEIPIQNGESVGCSPAFGTQLILAVSVTDAIGQYESFFKQINIVGGSGHPIDCAIATDKSAVAIGESVSATVHVTGGVEPLDIRCNWQAASERGNFTFITPEIPIQSGATVSCSPAFGTQLIVAVSVTDAIGQYESFYKQIPITGTPLLTFTPDSQTVWQPGSPNGLRTVVDADYTAFLRLAVDGNDVDPGDYAVAPGSTVITLYPAFLQTLPAGAHTLTAYFQTGYAQLRFVIGGVPVAAMDAGSADVPETGDVNAPHLWSGLWLIAAIALSCRVRTKKRRAKAE